MKTEIILRGDNNTGVKRRT